MSKAAPPSVERSFSFLSSRSDKGANPIKTHNSSTVKVHLLARNGTARRPLLQPPGEPKKMLTKAHITQAFLSFLLLLVRVPYAFAADTLTLGIGEEQMLQFEDLAETVNIERNVVTVTKGETKKTLIVKGRAAGSTNMTITLRNGQTAQYAITVVGAGGASSGVAAAVKNALPTLKTEIRGKKVYVSGLLRTHPEMEAFAAIKGQYSSVIVDLTEKQLVENDTVVKTINRVLADNGIPNIRSHAYGKLIVLEGSAKDEAQKKLALRIANMIYSPTEDQIDASSNGAPTISIEVVFIEVQKKDVKEFGFPGHVKPFGGGGNSPSDSIGAVRGQYQGVGGQTGRYSYVVGPFSSFLKLIQNRSMSRVLSNPKLVTRSGVQASFHSGETLFYTARSVTDKEVNYKLEKVPVGIKLEILPKIDAIGQIDAEISTEVSEVGADKSQEHPSVTGSEVKTAVTIKDGYSILLSGLVKKREQKNIERVPLLADIPIIGEIFKSRELRNEETELLVLVTMNRVQGTNELIKATDRLWQKSDDVEFSIFD